MLAMMGSDAANCFTRGSTAKTQPEQFTVDLKEKTMAKCTKLIKTYNYKICYREKMSHKLTIPKEGEFSGKNKFTVLSV